MALIACPECKKEISSAARACPSCGHPMRSPTKEVSEEATSKPRTGAWAKWALFAFLSLAGLTALGKLVGKAPDSNLDQQARALRASAPHTSSTLSFSDLERRIILSLFEQDFRTYAEGGDAIYSESMDANRPLIVKARDLQKDYEANEVASDKKYRKKSLAISGVVLSIDRSIGENYSIALKGGENPFIGPRAAMADGFTDYLAGLKKGQKVHLICRCDGLLLGSAMLSSCRPVDTWAKDLAVSQAASIQESIAAKDTNSVLLAVAGLAIASIPGVDSCFKSGEVNDRCLEKLGKSLDSTAYHRAFNRLGIDPKEWKKGPSSVKATAATTVEQ